MRRRLIRLAIFVLIGLAVVAYLGREQPLEVADGSTLLVTLQGEYVEASAPSLVMRAMGTDARPFAGLLSTFAVAERDDRLDTVVLRIRGLQLGWAKAQELRDAIRRLSEAGRRTIAVLEVETFTANKEYFVASAADEVFVTPGAIVPLVGLAAEYLYLGGLWEQIGLDIEVARVGKYKSAVETLAEKGMSDPAREMVNSLLDSTFEQFVADVAKSRDLPPAAVRVAFDAGPVLGEDLVRLSLADGVAQLEELDAMQGDVVKGNVYSGMDPAQIGFEPVARFALIHGTGNVVSGKGSISRSGQRVFASETVGQALRDAAEDPTIDAIIFRIDSPGGSSLAAESVWRAVEKAKESKKPVIASFSDLAASGGYYAAVGADAIVTGRGTLTGSIGVFALRPVLGGTFEKLGIEVESITRGKHADFLLSSERLSAGARERFDRSVQEIYRLFLERVSEGRSMSTADVDAVAQGRVWTGEQAFEQGLVDELGGLRAAVLRGKRALDLAEDADVALIPYPGPGSLAEQLQELLELQALGSLRSAWLQTLRPELPAPWLLERLRSWLVDLPTDAPLLVPPVLIEIR